MSIRKNAKSSKSAKSAKPEAKAKGGKAEPKRDPRKEWAESTKGLDATWKESRKVDPNSFGDSTLNVEDGTYVARIYGTGFGKQKKSGMPWVRLDVVITNGDNAGEEGAVFMSIREDNEGDTTAAFERMAKTLKRVCGHPDLNLDLDEMNLGDIPDVLDEIAKVKPGVQIEVKTTTAKSGKSAGKEFQNIYINQFVTDDNVDEIDLPGEE